MEDCSKETLEKATQSFYDRFSPFQCLAYWLVSSLFINFLISIVFEYLYGYFLYYI